MQSEFDIVITNMSRSDYEKLYNIAANKGVSFPLFMKQTLTRIAEKYKYLSDDYTRKETHKFFQIRSVNESTFSKIVKACDSLKCDVAPFLKVELHKIISEYPQELTQKPAVSAYHYRLK